MTDKTKPFQPTTSDNNLVETPDKVQQNQPVANSTKHPPFISVIFFFVLFLNIIFALIFKRTLDDYVQTKSASDFQQELSDGGFSKEFLEKTDNLEKLFPNQEKLIELISSINKASASFEKLDLSFESDEPIANKKQKYLPFILQASAKPDKIISLLQSFLDADFLVEIEDISLKSTDSFVSQTDLVIKANLYVNNSFY
ncbi:hypothetical protein KKE45_00955 [Patescibacteria group bacterium]|nr:hypothetical protein [Patescibacteria group bacterium]